MAWWYCSGCRWSNEALSRTWSILAIKEYKLKQSWIEFANRALPAKLKSSVCFSHHWIAVVLGKRKEDMPVSWIATSSAAAGRTGGGWVGMGGVTRPPLTRGSKLWGCCCVQSNWPEITLSITITSSLTIQTIDLLRNKPSKLAFDLKLKWQGENWNL